MLELGGNGAAPPAADLIKDISEATFMQDVVETSKEVPVIVDFWAPPWCGPPCKTLGPALEQAVTAAGGKVRMVKINVDENQQIAAQLRVQSIPTVYAFVDGQPVDGFQGGAQPPSEIAAFVDRVSKAGGAMAAWMTLWPLQMRCWKLGGKWLMLPRPMRPLLKLTPPIWRPPIWAWSVRSWR